MKNKIIVELCDKEFSLLSDESEEYVKSLAKEINTMIQETAYKNLRISKADAAVLSCLDLCDRNRKLAENNDNMRKTISEYIDEIGELNRKLAAYERQKAGRGARISNMDDEALTNQSGGSINNA
ncbi:MAG: cell division protein ZapA [Oscillospiraceae bacterium]|nr:cell division protein ZapA [Oscillospiraceae bacterium]